MSRSRTSREFRSRMDDFPGIPGNPGNISLLLYTLTIGSKHRHFLHSAYKHSEKERSIVKLAPVQCFSTQYPVQAPYTTQSARLKLSWRETGINFF